MSIPRYNNVIDISIINNLEYNLILVVLWLQLNNQHNKMDSMCKLQILPSFVPWKGKDHNRKVWHIYMDSCFS